MKWRKLPFYVYFSGLAAFAMLVPLLHAVMHEDWRIARGFLYGALVMGFLFLLLAIALDGKAGKMSAQANLATVLASYILLPVGLAIPMSLGMPTLSFSIAYFEMVSALTTTGATMFAFPAEVSESVHLWRGIVGWAGGALILFTAMAIMAPLNLGGFEVRSITGNTIGSSSAGGQGNFWSSTVPEDRMKRAARQVLPPYAVLTAALAFILITTGERPLLATMEAMATLSTSGITTAGTTLGNGVSELFIFLFLLLTSVHYVYQPRMAFSVREFWQEPEFRMLCAIVFGVSAALFLRHWISGDEIDSPEDIMSAVRAFWGSLFTAVSFLTTTGFVSAEWSQSQIWSGLGDTGLILLGLAAIGGGVATTAGGAKLLRVYAVYKQGLREVNRLTYPQAIVGSGADQRKIRKEGAFIAWICLMVLLLAVCLMMLTLSLGGATFIEAIWLSVAALTNTGPLEAVMGEAGLRYVELGDLNRWVFCAGMIVGRIEVLAIVALMTPEYWRR